MGFLSVRFEVRKGRKGGVKITPCPKLVRITIETWNLIRKYKHYVVSENNPFGTKILLILLMSVSFCKKSAFFSKNTTFTQSNIERAALEIF